MENASPVTHFFQIAFNAPPPLAHPVKAALFCKAISAINAVTNLQVVLYAVLQHAHLAILDSNWSVPIVFLALRVSLTVQHAMQQPALHVQMVTFYIMGLVLLAVPHTKIASHAAILPAYNVHQISTFYKT